MSKFYEDVMDCDQMTAYRRIRALKGRGEMTMREVARFIGAPVRLVKECLQGEGWLDGEGRPMLGRAAMCVARDRRVVITAGGVDTLAGVTPLVNGELVDVVEARSRGYQPVLEDLYMWPDY